MDWSLANDHFKAVLSNHPIKQEDLNSNIKRMNDVTFEYFSTMCGEVDRGGDINLRNKYKACTIRDLKRELKKLKLNGGNIRETKFVSRTLRNLLANTSDKISHNHDSYIKNNFGGMSKMLLNMSPLLFHLLVKLTVYPFLQNASQPDLQISVFPFLLGSLHFLLRKFHFLLIHLLISKSLR